MKRFSGALFLRDDSKDLDIHLVLALEYEAETWENRIAFIG